MLCLGVNVIANVLLPMSEDCNNSGVYYGFPPPWRVRTPCFQRFICVTYGLGHCSTQAARQ